MKKLLLLSLCFLMLCITQVFAQNRTITGTVTAKEDGSPMPGVTVKLKGTNTGTQTNGMGKYSLSIPEGSKTLIFSFVTYQTQQIEAPASGVLNVVLVSANKQLDEIVVTGYGSGKPLANITGSVSRVGAAEISDRPVPNALDALVGKISGLNILSSSGEPSSTPSLTFHGIGTLTSGSTPLIILDGSPVDVGTVLSLNPNDIKNVDFLKDASATSIYGARASNGVMLITTKTSTINTPTTINFSSQYGVSNLANTTFFNSFMNSAEFQAFQIKLSKATHGDSGQSKADQDKYLASLPVKNADTKWYKTYYKSNVPFYQEDISVSGGGGKTSYYVSGSYLNDDGIAWRSGYNRFTLRSNVTSVVNTWLKFGLNLSMGYDQRQTNPSGSNSTNLGLALLAAPYYSPIDPNGKPYTFIPGWAHYSPSYRANEILDPNNNTQFNPTAYIEITPIAGLTIRTQGGMDDYDYLETSTQLPSYLGSPGNGSVAEYFTRGTSKTFTNTAEYKFSLASVHHITILGGQEYSDGVFSAFGASSTGQADDRLVLLSAGPNNQKAFSTDAAGNTYSDYVYNSFFGRLDYDFNNKYYVEGSIRSDKSSKFGADHRQGTFWSAGVSWKAKEEDFLKDISWIDNFTVKANTGTSGNSDIGNYVSLPSVTTSSYGDGSARTSSGYYIQTPGNADLAWESQRLTTFAINTSFFDRIRLDLSYYIRNTSNMLLDVPYPFTSGFASVKANVGSMQNKGFDIDLEADVLRDKSHNAYITPFITANIDHNKVTSLFGGRDFYVVPNTGVAYEVGKPLSFFEPILKGVNSQTGAPEWYLPYPGAEGPKTTRKDPNAVSSDFDNDALQQNTGIPQFPWLVGSFGLKGGYGGFYGEARFLYNVGKHLTNNDRYFYENANAFPGYNQTKRTADFWTKPGDNALFPDPYNYLMTQFDSGLTENASFMRLKELTLGYVFPKAMLEHTKVIKGLQVYVIGRNLFTVTKYMGPDPEVDSNIALGNYPNTKQVSLGINATF